MRFYVNCPKCVNPMIETHAHNRDHLGTAQLFLTYTCHADEGGCGIEVEIGISAEPSPASRAVGME